MVDSGSNVGLAQVEEPGWIGMLVGNEPCQHRASAFLLIMTLPLVTGRIT